MPCECRLPCLGQDALPLQDTLPKQESGGGNPAQSATARRPKGGGGARRAGSATNTPRRGQGSLGQEGRREGELDRVVGWF